MGAYPRETSWAISGSANGQSYRHDAILMVSGGPAPSPFSKAFDPHRLPRIQAIEREIGYWLDRFDRHPEERYVSAGPDRPTVDRGPASPRN
jgi:hypothetical protein